LIFLKKKLILSKPGTRVLNRAGHRTGSENYAIAMSILQTEVGREQINNNKSNNLTNQIKKWELLDTTYYFNIILGVFI
jgi:hypothetical protein